MTAFSQAMELREVFEENNYRMSPHAIRKLMSSHLDLMQQTAPLKKDKDIKYKGKVIAVDFQRIVCGAHGPYVEFTLGDIRLELIIPQDQLWRKDPKYKVKYIHMCPKDIPELKIYRQVRPVTYADYKPNLYYIDFWLLTN